MTSGVLQIFPHARHPDKGVVFRTGRDTRTRIHTHARARGHALTHTPAHARTHARARTHTHENSETILAPFRYTTTTALRVFSRSIHSQLQTSLSCNHLSASLSAATISLSITLSCNHLSQHHSQLQPSLCWEWCWERWLQLRVMLREMVAAESDAERDGCSWEWCWERWLQLRMMLREMVAAESDAERDGCSCEWWLQLRDAERWLQLRVMVAAVSDGCSWEWCWERWLHSITLSCNHLSAATTTHSCNHHCQLQPSLTAATITVSCDHHSQLQPSLSCNHPSAATSYNHLSCNHYSQLQPLSTAATISPSCNHLSQLQRPPSCNHLSQLQPSLSAAIISLSDETPTEPGTHPLKYSTNSKRFTLLPLSISHCYKRRQPWRLATSLRKQHETYVNNTKPKHRHYKSPASLDYIKLGQIWQNLSSIFLTYPDCSWLCLSPCLARLTTQPDRLTARQRTPVPMVDSKRPTAELARRPHNGEGARCVTKAVERKSPKQRRILSWWSPRQSPVHGAFNCKQRKMLFWTTMFSFLPLSWVQI